MGFNFVIIGMLMFVFGIGLFLPARKARREDRIRETWPTVQGTVTSCRIVPQPPLADKRTEILQYDMDVKYQFRSGGQLHFGSAVSYPRYLRTKEEADRIAARYPAGTDVTVHHNPEDVRECYLEIQKTAKNYRASIGLMALGVLVGLAGFFAVVL
jgi:hypothetical protein